MLGNSVDQIARVTANLRPMTALPDHQTTVCSLSERMAHFASPGVSIAVIDSGRIASKRGFGMRTNGLSEPVGAVTCFRPDR